MPTPEPSAAYVPRDAKVCRPECRNPDYNECADCWKDGGNPALYPRPASDAAKRQELPYELQDGSHVCYVEADPDDGMPAHYRPCLEGARDDLARIGGASVEDGGVWIGAVAESRLPLIDAAITETDKSLVVLGSFNVGL